MDNDRKPREHCGLCGVTGGEGLLERLHDGLQAQQHRGQEAAGVMVSMDGACRLHRGPGLVEQVFATLPTSWLGEGGAIQRGISHVRYGTAGDSIAANAQPLLVDMAGITIGIAHNGTICNARSLRRELHAQGAIFQTTTDTEIILHLMARALMTRCRGRIWDAFEDALRQLRGAFSLLAMTADAMVAARDPFGFRPLAIGDFNDGAYIVASETIAFGVTGASTMREVEPGEMIVWDSSNRLESRRFAECTRRAHCIFEHVYFARPGSYVFGDSVYEVRREMGRRLAREAPVDADVIVPVPDSGMYAALGFAEESGIPLDMALSRNHYIGRTFIDPALTTTRCKLATNKLHPIPEALCGKRICLVDDSIVRGNTSRSRVHTLREAGAREVHMRVSCPPHRFGCYFGIDFPQREALFANKVPAADAARSLRLDSLAYLSRNGMLSCVRARRAEDFCCACFDGDYPVLPDQLDERPL
ncbi:MAG: amidophosphoribosyltransferase [Lentisphaeria bacterium]|nr:amidophosphoribosyltransferase [Lentisphaeria bacterium]